jgi:anti-sigma factor RsiW
MSEPQDEIVQGRALWRQWMAAGGSSAASQSTAPVIDALTLAAYAEGRLPPAERDIVDELLAEYPELAADVAVARQSAATSGGSGDALSGVIARACALVPASDDRVVAFRPKPRGAGAGWRDTARWSALAASFLIVSYVGFSLGSDASLGLAGLTQSVASADDVLDPPIGLFGGLADVSGT